MVYLREEGTSNPPNLIRIAVFAAVPFLLMAAMVEKNARAAVLVCGVFVLLLLGLAAGWLKFQQRYGDAYLKATSELASGKVFQGEIETGLTRVPGAPVRIDIHFAGYRQGASIEITPQQMRLGPSGQVVIPFSIPIPGDERRPARYARMYIRTRTWPIGWGATFLFTA
jgi:hypothetical protein